MSTKARKGTPLNLDRRFHLEKLMHEKVHGAAVPVRPEWRDRAPVCGWYEPVQAPSHHAPAAAVKEPLDSGHDGTASGTIRLRTPCPTVGCIRPQGHTGIHLYRCAGVACPGLAWKASDHPHPVSCVEVPPLQVPRQPAKPLPPIQTEDHLIRLSLRIRRGLVANGVTQDKLVEIGIPADHAAALILGPVHGVPIEHVIQALGLCGATLDVLIGWTVDASPETSQP